VRMNLEGECWAWNETRVTDFLAKKLKTSIAPSPPQNLHVHYEDGGLLIKWDSPLTDTGTPLQYIIQRKDEKNDVVSETIDAKSTMYKDTSVIPGKKYSYQVIAQNSAGQSTPSDEYRIQLSLAPPQISCSINAYDDFFEINWEKVGKEFDLDHFILLQGLSPGNLNPLDITLSGEISTYKNYDVKPGTKYFFRIDTHNKNGMKTTGIISSPVLLKQIPPPQPPIHPVSALYQEGVQVSWAPPENGTLFIDSFCVYRESGQESKILLAVLPSDQTTYYDSSAAAGETHTYSISSKNPVCESNIIQCKTLTIPSSLPPNIKKWQSETLSFANKDPHLFFKQVSETIGKLLATHPEEFDDNEKDTLVNIKKLLEGMKNE
jgi:hypothetical protein